MPGLEQSAADSSTASRYIQLQRKYIVSAAKSGLMVIDQYRAHIRILFDRFITSTSPVASQKVLFPEVIEFQPAISVLLTSIADDLRRSGFDLTFMGGCSWSLSGLPPQLAGLNPRETLGAILDDIVELGRDGSEPIARRIALSMARAAAVHPGTLLSEEEMAGIVGDLLMLPTPDRTPDGHLIISIISNDSIAHPFQ